MVIEMILIIAILFTAFAFVSSQMKERKVLASLVGSPWGKLAGLIENGVWGDGGDKGIKDGRLNHPNHIKRHISYKE